MKFNNVEITQESILKTRLHFCEISLESLRNAVEYGSKPKDQLTESQFFVNDLLGYMVRENQYQEDMAAGKHDCTFTFMQRAYWIQTGEMIALFWG